MVHALKETHRILRPNGLLINVHDIPVPQAIAVQTPETIHRLGWILYRDDLRIERSSLYALAGVVAEGSFMLEDERDFPYNIYVDGLMELQEWLAEWWESAVLDDSIVQQLAALTGDAYPSARILIALRARMTKLRAAELG